MVKGVKNIPMASASVEFEGDVLACFPGYLGGDRDADIGVWEEELGFGVETVECGAEEGGCEGRGVEGESCDEVVPKIDRSMTMYIISLVPVSPVTTSVFTLIWSQFICVCL
jgi:hypothetical protein